MAPGAEVIEADGPLALPGFVDMHTHLREPGFEASETVASGTLARRGAVSPRFAMANTDPVTDWWPALPTSRHCRAAGNAEVFPVGSITIGLAGERLSPIAEMAPPGYGCSATTVAAS